MAAATSAICCSRRRQLSTATRAESPSCFFPAPVSKKSAIWLKKTQVSSKAVKGSGWKSAALKVGTASIFQRIAALRTAGSAVPAAIWSADRSISPHMGPTSERILSRTWLTFTAIVSARLSILGARMEAAQPTEDATRTTQGHDPRGPVRSRRGSAPRYWAWSLVAPSSGEWVPGSTVSSRSAPHAAA